MKTSLPERLASSAAAIAIAGNDPDQMADGKIDSMLTVDLQYNYPSAKLLSQATRTSVGLQNIFDEVHRLYRT